MPGMKTCRSEATLGCVTRAYQNEEWWLEIQLSGRVFA
jgi:hypothetical protein